MSDARSQPPRQPVESPIVVRTGTRSARVLLHQRRRKSNAGLWAVLAVVGAVMIGVLLFAISTLQQRPIAITKNAVPKAIPVATPTAPWRDRQRQAPAAPRPRESEARTEGPAPDPMPPTPAPAPVPKPEPARRPAKVELKELKPYTEPFPSGNAYTPEGFSVDLGLAPKPQTPGIFLVRHPNGSPYALGTRNGRELEGVCFGAHANHNPQFFVACHKDQPVGIATLYNLDGKIVFGALYNKYGRRHGIACLFDKEEEPLFMVDFEHDQIKSLRVVTNHAIALEYNSLADAEAGEIVPPLLARMNKHFDRLGELEIELRQAARDAEAEERAAKARKYTFENRGKAAERANARAAADAAAYAQVIGSLQKINPVPSSIRKPIITK